MFWIVASLCLYLTSLYNYLLFHSLVELFGIVITGCVFVIVWNTRKQIDNSYLVFIGVSFFFVAFLDSIHFLSYQGMKILPSATANHATQFWVSARYLQSLSFLLAFAYLKRSLEFDILFACYCIVTVLLVTTIVFSVFPDCFVEGQGLTMFKKVSEGIIASILVFVIFLLYRKKTYFEKTMYRLLIMALAAIVVSELFFAAYASVHGFSNLVGHFFKLLSGILIYKAIIETGLLKPYQVLFRNLKQNEEKLQENEARLNEAQRISKVGHWTINLVDENVTGSDEFFRIYKWDPQVLSADYDMFLQAVHPDDRGRVKRAYEKSVKNRTIFESVHRLLLDDDSVEYVKVRCETFYGESGTPLQSLGIVQDITKEKKVEFALAESQDFLEKIVENIPDMVVVKDAKELRFMRFNKAGEELLGCDRQELLGKNDHEFFSKSEADYFTEKDKEVLNSRKLLDIDEEKLQTKDKGTRMLHTKRIPILNTSGEVEYILGISEDITDQLLAEKERERMERQLQQAQKMEAIGTLAGGIAHDFNNIIHIILGYTGLAKTDVPDELTTVQKELDQVVTAAQKAKVLIKQILTFSRRSNGEMQLLNPSLIAKEALKLLRSSLPVIIDIKQDIDPECGMVMADPTEIHQILMNLCTNAYHSMEGRGGVLTVALGRFEYPAEDGTVIQDMKPGTYIRLKVSDTGMGISEENRDKIYDPYFTTKEQGKGTGLGLSVIHGIVTSYEGSIQIESEQGMGTTFTIFLPVFQEPAEDENEIEESLVMGKERILLVDDEAAVAELGKDMLERLGYSVTAISNSLEAFEMFENDPDRFDIILSDQTMPGMTGVQLVEAILKIKPGMPIILCSGFSNQVSEDEAMEIGISGFCMKPFVLEDIAKLIRSALDE